MARNASLCKPSLCELRHARRMLFLAVLVLLAQPALSWARSYHIAKYVSTIHVDNDGSAHIAEKITLAFSGHYEGIYRNIPVDFPGPNGSNHSVFIKIDKVTDDAGSPLKFEKSTGKGYLKLK